MTEVKTLACTIRDVNTDTLYIPYIDYGTMGFVKSFDGNIYQCKLIGAKWNNVQGYTKPTYRWRIAGIGDMDGIEGSASKLPIGRIYETLEYAKKGTSNTKLSMNEEWKLVGKMKEHSRFNVVDYLCDKYGFDERNFSFGKSFSNFSLYTSTIYPIKLLTWGITEDKCVKRFSTDFNLYVDKDGIDLDIPSMDKNERFTTKEQADKAVGPYDVFLFQDSEMELIPSEKTETEEVTITIKVKKNKVERITKFAELISGGLE